MTMSLGFFYSRLSFPVVKLMVLPHIARSISTSQTLLITPSPYLFAEPLKKKRKIDPIVLKLREERKKKVLEKSIKRMQRFAQPLKPVDELIVPLALQDEKELRKRDPPKLSSEEEDERALLVKSWCRYRLRQHQEDIKMLGRIIHSQERALSELRKVSEELYQAALQIDDNLLAVEVSGPVVTPPIKDYDSPDGDYFDVSYKWG